MAAGNPEKSSSHQIVELPAVQHRQHEQYQIHADQPASSDSEVLVQHPSPGTQPSFVIVSASASSAAGKTTTSEFHHRHGRGDVSDNVHPSQATAPATEHHHDRYHRGESLRHRDDDATRGQHRAGIQVATVQPPEILDSIDFAVEAVRTGRSRTVQWGQDVARNHPFVPIYAGIISVFMALPLGAFALFAMLVVGIGLAVTLTVATIAGMIGLGVLGFSGIFLAAPATFVAWLAASGGFLALMALKFGSQVARKMVGIVRLRVRSFVESIKEMAGISKPGTIISREKAHPHPNHDHGPQRSIAQENSRVHSPSALPVAARQRRFGPVTSSDSEAGMTMSASEP